MSRSFEYKFVRLGEGWAGGYGTAKYYELIFERER